MALQEMSGTYAAIRFVQQQAIRTDRLIAVVLNDRGFPRDPAKDQRNQRRTGQMSDVAGANQPPQLNCRGATENAERECAIIEIPSRGLRDDDNFKFKSAIRQAKLGKAISQRKRDGLNASDAWRKKMTVNQKLHNEDLDRIFLGDEQRKCILPFTKKAFSLQQRAIMFLCQYSDIARAFAVLSWPEMKAKIQVSLSQATARHHAAGTVR